MTISTVITKKYIQRKDSFLYATNILYYFLCNNVLYKCVAFNDEMIWNWHGETERHLDTFGEGNTMLIFQTISKTFIKFSIKEMHRAGIGAGCS